MNYSPVAVWLAQHFEGLRLKVEADPLDRRRGRVIGYGHTDAMPGPWPGDTIDAAGALRLLYSDLAYCSRQVAGLIQAGIVFQGQFDALVDFNFNLGYEDFSNSTLLKLLNQRDYYGASKQFGRWVYSDGVVRPGLVRRRAIECVSFCRSGFPTT